jgi:hypothetical protein
MTTMNAMRSHKLLITRKPSSIHVVAPVKVSAAVAALESLVTPGGPRWAVTVWAVALLGPMRDAPRTRDADDVPGESSLESLLDLVDRCAPAPASVVWPGWMRGSKDEAVLMLGVGQGKADRRVVVDIPEHAKPLVVPLVTGSAAEEGLARALVPSWTGDVMSSDGRLLALVELVGRNGQNPSTLKGSVRIDDAVSTLVAWCAGPGRAATRPWPNECGALTRTAASALGATSVQAVAEMVMAAAGVAG